MSKGKSVLNVDGEYNFPRGFTISDNRIEDMLQRLVTPAEYVVWRQYLRFWGSNKKKAYPSLSYLSQVTGLSEKTIRKCNKELKRKGFLGYITGGPGRSNVYTFRDIPSLIKKFYGSEDAKNVFEAKEEDNEAPIREVDKSKVIDIFDESNLSAATKLMIDEMVDYFSNAYSKYYGYSYEVDERDIYKIIEKAEDINQGKYFDLIDTMFSTKNSYIKTSDHSMYFFFMPSTQKAIIAEFNESETGRWTQQANQIWATLLPITLPDEIKDPEKWVRDKAHLGGANKARDEYVVAILVEKVKQFLER